MKTIKHKILVLLCILLYISGYSQQDSAAYFYYYKGEKIFLELNTQTIALTTEGDNSPQTIQSFLLNDSRKKFIIMEDHAKIRANIIDQQALDRKDVKTYYMEITSDLPLSKEEYAKQIENYKKTPTVITVSPCFITKEGRKVGLSNTFNVKLKNENDLDLLYEKAKQLNIEVLGHNEFMPLWFTLSCNKKTNSLETANLFYKTGVFEYAEPIFSIPYEVHSTNQFEENSDSNFKYQDVEHSSTSQFENSKQIIKNQNLTVNPPNDPYYPYQWQLNNTGQVGIQNIGIDIKAQLAWTISKGSDIKVAVVDCGFQMNHPDLRANVYGKGYDASLKSEQKEVYNIHATPMAGIIGAVQNNRIGISGVAPSCKLISVGLGDYTKGFYPEYAADAINWAWQNGADVICNAWSYILPEQIVEDAITNALTKGRNGKGSVVVFPAGNFGRNNWPIPWPGNSNPLILVVGGIYSTGERAPESCEGPELDIMAPGTSYSTDRTGSNGYNQNSMSDDVPDLDYTFKFKGTSASSPYVAGVAALVLSVNPNLTVQQVNNFIESSANKTRSDLYTYSVVPNHLNGTWNNKMGYGLVNAFEAVKLAKASLETMCPTNLDITENVIAPNTISRQSSEYITASNTINSGARATYDAGYSIKLKTGFKAVKGSFFKGYLEGCINNDGNRFSSSPIQEKITYDFRYNTTGSLVANNRLENDKTKLNAEPNPFTHKIKISYQTTSNSGMVHISIYSITGIKVADLPKQNHTDSGTHTIEWDATGFPTGTYLINLTTANSKEDIKVIKL